MAVTLTRCLPDQEYKLHSWDISHRKTSLQSSPKTRYNVSFYLSVWFKMFHFAVVQSNVNIIIKSKWRLYCTMSFRTMYIYLFIFFTMSYTVFVHIFVKITKLLPLFNNTQALILKSLVCQSLILHK